jgi:hypothetical protein
MIKHHTTRRTLAPGIAVVATAALVFAGCSGDDAAPDAVGDVTVELSPEAEAALDEAQEAAEQAEEAAEEARDEAEDALDDVLASVPDVAEGEPSDSEQESLPSADLIEALGECFGIDVDELSDFDQLEDALDDVEDLDLGTLPGGSVPFDMSVFEDLEDISEMSPEEIQELVEDEFAELEGALSSVPDMTIPPISMPEFSVPSLPFDPDELEDCLSDAADR